MKSIIISIVFLFLITAISAGSTFAETQIFFQESIDNTATYRYTKYNSDSGDVIWEETTDGNSHFGKETKFIEIKHSIDGILPPLLPDGEIFSVSLKVFVRKGAESKMTMSIDSLDFENVHKRKILFKSDDCDCDDDDDDSDKNNYSLTGYDDDDDDCDCDDENMIYFENSILNDGILIIKVDSDCEKENPSCSFIIEKSVLTVTYSPTVITDVPDSDLPLPTTVKLSQNYPNPFNPSTTIEFALQEKTVVTIDIINVRGQKIRTLLNEEKSAGAHTVVWDGKNSNGNLVSTGVYFYRITAGKYINANKMIMLK